MATPNSPPIKMSDVKAEFNLGNNLRAYLGCAPGVPTSGTIKLTDLLGKASGPDIDEYNAWVDSVKWGPTDYSGISTISVGAPPDYELSAFSNLQKDYGDMTGSPRYISGYNSNVRNTSTFMRVMQHMVESKAELDWMVDASPQPKVLIHWNYSGGKTDMLGENINGYNSGTYTGYGTAGFNFRMLWMTSSGILKKRVPNQAVTTLDFYNASSVERHNFIYRDWSRRRMLPEPETDTKDTEQCD